MKQKAYVKNTLKHTTDPAFAGYVFLATQMDHAQLEGVNFTQCSFNSCDMSSARFSRCIFVSCTFVGCKMPLAKLHSCTLDGCTFENCYMAGASLASSDIKSCTLDGCEMRHAKLNKAHLHDTHIKNGRLQQAGIVLASIGTTTLTDCDLKGAVFGGSWISGLSIDKCFGNGLNMREAEIYNLRVKDSRLAEMHFTHASLYNCEFEHSKIPGISFISALLQGCVFSSCKMGQSFGGSAQIKNTSFSACDLGDASWHMASVDNCEFTGSDLTGAKLTPGTDTWLPLYGRWDIVWQPSGQIAVGCQTKHATEWLAWLESDQEYSTPRSRGDFARIKAGIMHAVAMWQIHQDELAGHLESMAGTQDQIHQASLSTSTHLALVRNGTSKQRVRSGQPGGDETAQLLGDEASMIIIDDPIRDGDAWIQMGQARDGTAIWWQPMSLAEMDTWPEAPGGAGSAGDAAFHAWMAQPMSPEEIQLLEARLAALDGMDEADEPDGPEE